MSKFDTVMIERETGAPSTAGKSCRFCFAGLPEPFLDLGVMPLANSYLKDNHARQAAFPLRVFFCESCGLVQQADYAAAEEIFDDQYAYFSSFSSSWLEHARRYVDYVTDRFQLNVSHHVIEIASNDGYLLRNFVERKIPALGIEPCANVARAAEDQGVPTRVSFFGRELAGKLVQEGRQADLLIGNNVLAHVPDINDFVAGMKMVLKPDGVITCELPHLMRLVEGIQFDTIYHEHFSYYSLFAAEIIFARYGLVIFDVEELPTHGGSLRIFARHAESEKHPVSKRVRNLLELEKQKGYQKPALYEEFSRKVCLLRSQLLELIAGIRKEGKIIAGYGAPAKGNTLLNFCGITAKDIPFTVDISPHKQGMFLPGSRIPIHGPEYLLEKHPDYVMILPWNLQEEIVKQMAEIRTWGGKFILPVPEPRVLE